MLIAIVAIAILVVVAVSVVAAGTPGAAARARSSDDDPSDLSPQEAILAARTLGRPVYGFNGDGSRGDESQAVVDDDDR